LTRCGRASSINRLGNRTRSGESGLAQAREWLAQATSVAVLTGAGISAESGVPTFRGPGGLWMNFRPEELATPEAFERDPRLVWEWYDWRRSIIAKARPNNGHHALVDLEPRVPHFRLITQNVDGLHDAAGNHHIVKVHGDIWLLRCLSCGREETNRVVPLDPLPPRCACGGMQRPGVVWFGEALPVAAIERACEAARHCEVFLCCGTSAVVYPAAALPGMALEAGAKLIEVNLEATALSPLAHVSLLGKAGDILPQIIGCSPPD
jgi:NAD-dependent deacetylase